MVDICLLYILHIMYYFVCVCSVGVVHSSVIMCCTCQADGIAQWHHSYLPFLSTYPFNNITDVFKFKSILTTTTILRPLYRSTSFRQHLQLKTGGFCQCKVLPPACPC